VLAGCYAGLPLRCFSQFCFDLYLTGGKDQQKNKLQRNVDGRLKQLRAQSDQHFYNFLLRIGNGTEQVYLLLTVTGIYITTKSNIYMGGCGF
jgi:hypothetical protein